MLPCCIEGPDEFIPKARYAVEMLLLGLGLTPDWIAKDALTEAGLYYGPQPGSVENGALCVALKPETLAFFSARRAITEEECGVLQWDGGDWLLPFGEQGAGVLGELPDVIAAAFFWLSGWQEYTTTERDQHGRFPYTASLQAKLDIALQPLVDVYRAWLGERLSERGVAVPGRTWSGKPWAVALTHDIDFIETRKRSRLMSLVHGKLGEAFAEWGKEDPRRKALYLMKSAEVARRITATYFFKGGASAPEDVGYGLDEPWLRRFMDGLKADGFEIGFHPSYAAYDHPQRLRDELRALKNTIGLPLRSVRTHFLRWVDPTTPRMLDQAGFRVDSSLGFSKHEGFRRATCHPFRLFDLVANRPLEIWEMPLAVMDTTLVSHRGLSGEEATESIQAVFAAAKRVGGCAVLLWHNTLYDEVNFPGQAAVFERTMDAAIAEGAFVGSLRDMVREYVIT